MEPENAIDPVRFVEQIEVAAEEVTTSHRGRRYVYINNEQEIRAFEDHAVEAGFNKIDLNRITELAEQVIPHLGYEHQERLSIALHALASHSIQTKTANPNVLVQLFARCAPFLTPSLEIERRTIRIADSIDPLSQGTMDGARMDRLQNFLPQATTVARSSEGHYGVVFLSNLQAREVFKLDGLSSGSICADHLLTLLGFSTSQEAVISSTHPLGLLIRETISRRVEEDQPVRANHIRRQLQNLERESSCIVHMPNIEATSFSEVPILTVESVLQNRGARNEMGRMIFVDAFMGNDDRLSIILNRENRVIDGVLNVSNFMLNAHREPENPIFTLIDSDFVLEASHLEAAKRRVSFLLDANNPDLDVLLGSMINRMGLLRRQDVLINERLNILRSRGIEEEEAVMLLDHPLIPASDEELAQTGSARGFKLNALPENWYTLSREQQDEFFQLSLREYIFDIKEGMREAALSLVAELQNLEVVNDLLTIPGMSVTVNPLTVMELKEFVQECLER